MEQPLGGFDDLVVVEGADIAKSLGQNNIGRGLAQRLFVNGVEPLAGVQELADFAIDLRARHAMWIDGAAHNDPLMFGFGRIIALVRDADDLIAETERKHDFRRAGQEGTDAHLL